MRRILFLDVDGVLNSHAFLSSITEETRTKGAMTGPFDSKHGTKTYDPADMIDPAQVARLNAILEGLDVDVVLSSSWRHAYTVEQMQGFLDRKGFKGRLYDVTPTHVADRADEIRKWLNLNFGSTPYWNEQVRFVVLDDSPDAGVGLEKHFVQTHQGLTDEDVAKARRILEGE